MKNRQVKKKVLYKGCLLLLLTVLSVPTMAQKKEIQTARDLVKSGKNLATAQNSMEKLLKDSVNRGNKKIWKVLYDAVLKQYEQGNEKLYLKEKYDTATWFGHARQLFTVAQSLDSVDALPDKKGRVEMEYRKSHAAYLSQIRKNLYTGANWLLRKQKYADAYRFFDTYIETASAPLFRDYDYKKNDRRLPEASYWAVYCGYKMQNAKATLHHAYEALKDTAHYEYMMQYLAETYKLEKDTLRYEQTLKDGFSHAPEFPFFFPRLIELYTHRGQQDAALALTEKALQTNPKNKNFLFAQSSLLLELGKNRESLEVTKTLLDGDDVPADLYYNAGIACYNMAVEKEKEAKTKKEQKEVVRLYKDAKPYMEEYRKLEPKESGKWALPLYTIYLNLNMGTEFDEMDRLLKNNK